MTSANIDEDRFAPTSDEWNIRFWPNHTATGIQPFQRRRANFGWRVAKQDIFGDGNEAVA